MVYSVKAQETAVTRHVNHPRMGCFDIEKSLYVNEEGIRYKFSTSKKGKPKFTKDGYFLPDVMNVKFLLNKDDTSYISSCFESTLTSQSTSNSKPWGLG